MCVDQANIMEYAVYINKVIKTDKPFREAINNNRRLWEQACIFILIVIDAIFYGVAITEI